MAALVNKCVILNFPNAAFHQTTRGFRLIRKKFISMSFTNTMKANAMYPSLKQRINALNPKLQDPALYKKVNIGFALKDSSAMQLERRNERILSKKKKDKALEKLAWLDQFHIDCRQVDIDFNDSVYRCWHVKRLASHYHIFNHLFNEYAYFYPVTKMEISFDYGESMVSPVYFGNLLKPAETSKEPEVKIDSEPNDLWTLILLNPDGNLYKKNAEVAHWFVGNIPGGNVKEGEEIIDYMQPIPPNGTGYHRFVFLLYKQVEKIDFSKYKVELPCLNLRDRTFRNRYFYRELEDKITPSGLYWFQADYDRTISDFFHHKLDMKEPSYEYEFPAQYIRKEKMYPFAQHSFNRYIDLHKDPKDLQKDILKQRLLGVDPIEGDIDLLPYPLATLKPARKYTPIWLHVESKKKLSGIGKYRDYYRYDARPPSRRYELRKENPPKWELK